MPHIRQIEVDEATGLLAKDYDAAIDRAGKVFNIVKAMCLNPTVLAFDGPLQGDHVRPLRAIGPSGLFAVVVSHRQRLPLLDCTRAFDDLRTEGAPDELAEHAYGDYRRADLEPRVLALRDFAVKVTREPAGVGLADTTAPGPGVADTAIHDGVQVVSFFNYVNRTIAEAVSTPSRRSGTPVPGIADLASN